MEQKKKKLKVVTGFAGYGGDKFALQLANIPYEEIGFSEIDKYAIQCHKQNHEGENLGSMTDINPNELSDFDLFTGGFPCQKFSIAGKGEGAAAEDGGGLLFNEIIRICEVKKPKYILLENVKGLMSKKHNDFFEFTKSELKRIGYNIDVSLYNSKNYGIPQNRERVFYVCIRNDLEFNYNKPKQIELNLFLKDILENRVEDKYFLSEKAINYITNETRLNKKYTQINGKIALCETAKQQMNWTGTFIKPIQLNKSKESHNQQPFMQNRVYDSRGVSPAVCSVQPFIQIKNATKKGYLEAKQGDGISLEHPNSTTRRGRVQEQMSPTLQCNDSKGVVTDNLRIRKLTPKECFRLMGFLNDQINIDGISNSQQYKLAGNGWEINLVSKIMQGFLKTTIK